MLDRNTKKARVKVTGNVRQYGLRKNIVENVEKCSTICDALKSYRNLDIDGFVHEFIDHTEEYVRGRVHTNGLENFWGLFAHPHTPMVDYDRFKLAMTQIVGKRLTWDRLTGKQSDPETCVN